MEVKKHGGKRQGSGRKPVADKKQAVFLYIQKSVIEKNGGTTELKRKLLATLN